MDDIASLPEGGAPLRVEYSREAMERIRRRARGDSGLVGGVLLGERRAGGGNQPGRVRITGSVELNPAEMGQARDAVQSNAAAIGIYCSSIGGDTVLSGAWLALFDELFPNEFRIALVLKPGASQAAVFYRSPNKDIMKLGEFEVMERSQRSSETVLTITPEARNSVDAATGLFGVPGLMPPRPHRRTNWWMQLMVVAAATAVIAAVYVTEDSWLPKPPLTLTSSEQDGKLSIQWDPAAVRGVRHGFMYVNDGGDLERLPLDRGQLQAGVWNYVPKSHRVTARLEAGEANAVTNWADPASDSRIAPAGPDTH
jgi:hypothetical protein